MRLYELANEHGIEDKKQLLKVLNEAGFEVKNSLSSVGDDVIEWVAQNAPSGAFDSSESESESAKSSSRKSVRKKKAVVPAAADLEEEKAEEPEQAEPESEDDSEQESSGPSVKKKVKRRVKVRVAEGVSGAEIEEQIHKDEPAAKPVAEEPKPEPEEAEEDEAPVKEKRRVVEKAPVEDFDDEDYDDEDEDEDEEEQGRKAEKELVFYDINRGGVLKPGEKPEAPADLTKKTITKRSKKKDKDKAKKGRVQLQKARGGTEISLNRASENVSADAASNDVVIEEEEDSNRQTGQHHKRADFKGSSKHAQLPAMFQEMDFSYTRSLTGGGKRRRGRGQGQNVRHGRNKRVAKTAPREKDPNAISQVMVGMTVRDLSNAIGVKINSIVQYFMKNGQLVNVNESLSEEDITLICEEFQANYEWKVQQDIEQELEREFEEIELATEDSDLVERPPVITFLGHVDHGKTSLLDKIRHSRVAAHEAGGITQHIGAYTIEKNGQEITFLDTPGHEAFTAMRARGANLTDIAVLVVAADDGVMPQTEEACSHAKNAGVPIVIAINKCDVPNANPDKVRQELSNRLGLLPEVWGGSVGMIEVSAHTGQGIDELLERILLESEMLELKADPRKSATGHVLEAKVSESRGVVATVLISDGTLLRGDVILCSAGYGKVKLMYNEFGETVDEAGPGYAVRIVGLSNVPETGDRVYVLDDISRARAIAEKREREARAQALSKRAHVTLDNLLGHLAEEGMKELRVVIKADVKGSLEVLEKTITDLSNDEVKIVVIHSGVGGVNQADVILADASDAIIVGFHVVADSSARLQASSLGVQIKIYHIIYRLIEDMRAALEGMLPPEEREVVQGHLDIRQVFKASRIGNIAGCYVTDGFITRTSRLRLIRENVVIYDGGIDALKRFKDDAKEVREGYECGVKVAGYDDIKEGDRLEAYAIEEFARKLE
ncbi:MAG: translation initiation factor IF-2 [Planctomycetes bacterium]|nr:translation initiation factor IF-2 [Planctomycetota bacterium]